MPIGGVRAARPTPVVDAALASRARRCIHGHARRHSPSRRRDRRRRHRPRGHGRGGEGAARRRRRPRHDGFDLGGQRYLRDGEILSDATLDELRAVRRHPARRRRHAGGAAGRDRAGAAAEDALRARPVRQPAARSSAPEPRLRRDPREHRGPVRRRGRRAAQGHAARGRHPGQRQHADGRRALRALRLRAGPQPGPQAPDARPQDERADVRRRPVAAHVRRGRRRVPRRRHRLPPRRRGDDLLRPGPAALRRHRHRQPVRRHPHRPRRRRVGRRRPGLVGQPQPGAHRPEHVRAGARLGARHRRHRRRRPARGDPVGGADARLPRRGRRRRRGSARPAPSRSAGSTTSVGDAIAARVGE